MLLVIAWLEKRGEVSFFLSFCSFYRKNGGRRRVSSSQNMNISVKAVLALFFFDNSTPGVFRYSIHWSQVEKRFCFFAM